MQFKWIFFCLILFSFFKVQAQNDEEYVESYKNTKKPIFSKDLYEYKNPDYTSYFISPTAFTITKRDFRIAGNDFIFYKLTYGLTGKTNVSINTSLFGSIIGSIKHSFDVRENNRFALSASFGDFTAALKDTSIWFGGADAVYTIGNHENNMSFGTGFYSIKTNLELLQRNKLFYFHSITFGIQRQIAKKTFLMAEGYYFTNYSIFTGAGGLKFIIKSKYALNIGVMPILWNNIRQNRYSPKPFVIPVVSLRMLIKRRD